MICSLGESRPGVHDWQLSANRVGRLRGVCDTEDAKRSLVDDGCWPSTVNHLLWLSDR